MKLFLWLFVLIIAGNSVFADTLPVSAKNSMVVSDQYLASEIGANILRSGGNAIDAAVAIGYALAVVNPCCGNIGGGGFMTLHLADGKNIFINFRERAPLHASANMFLAKNGEVVPGKSTYGYLAVATPGTVMGLDTALKQYGTMTRQQVMRPAIQLAEYGYRLTAGDIKFLDEQVADFKKSPNIARIFLRRGDKAYRVGDRLIQTNLANTLKLISAQGVKAFYQGKIAEQIVAASQQNGGILTMRDFADYRVEIMTPLHCTYRGYYTVYSAPPPSSGGVTLCELLNILENFSLKKPPAYSAETARYMLEAMRQAYADRNEQLGDPDFVSNPVDRLISKNYAKRISDSIKAAIVEIPPNPAIKKEGVNTTHYSVVDKFGNAVAVTYTLNSFFGAGVIAGNTGFFLNNEMDDFSAKVGFPNQFGLKQSEKNKIAPGKRPLSSMTPTIITEDGHTVMVVGSPGGSRIITATLETILNLLDYRMNLQQAVDTPRFHEQGSPVAVDIEPNAFTPETMKKLTQMGYTFRPIDHWGAVEAIYISPRSKILYGANDKRCPAGKAIGN